MGSFKVGDRVCSVDGGWVGVIIGMESVVMYDVMVFNESNRSCYFFKSEIRLDKSWYREQKLKRLLDE